MMAKLNALPPCPRRPRASLPATRRCSIRCRRMKRPDATINLIYRSYYAEMGAHWRTARCQAHSPEPVKDNVTAFKRPPAKRPKSASSEPNAKPRLPVALIFACLVVVYVGVRYYLR